MGKSDLQVGMEALLGGPLPDTRLLTDPHPQRIRLLSVAAGILAAQDGSPPLTSIRTPDGPDCPTDERRSCSPSPAAGGLCMICGTPR